MSHRYAQLPSSGQDNASRHDREVEMEAAFDYSDDEDDAHNASESQPLNPRPAPIHVPAPFPPQHSPGTYNFESVDYDHPPPGSPPPPSATALPNNIGNSNGLIPTFAHHPTQGPRQMWFQRAAGSVLPSSVLSRIGLASRRPDGPVGGGTNNDGVFANVAAKPTAPVRVQEGDDSYLVPEDSRPEAPPSYASAQADSVPPYWETTIHAPFSSDSIGDMVIDNLPTGSLFSFCWNLLVSVSFQFVGFLLTYLLHTSHAARLGSRAGLGVTLIQYGFALRSRIDNTDGTPKTEWDWSDPNEDGFHGHHHHHDMGNITWSTPVANMTEEQASILVADSTTEWLSFFLMTIGWFVLLTSLLGFWRVKRWEAGIIASRNDPSGTSQAPRTGPNIVSNLESSFGLRGISRIELLRQGFGFGGSRNADPAEETETHPMIPAATPAPVDPERAQLVAAALANEARLQRDLREAGLL